MSLTYEETCVWRWVHAWIRGQGNHFLKQGTWVWLIYIYIEKEGARGFTC